jgi:hypothetical protein
MMLFAPRVKASDARQTTHGRRRTCVPALTQRPDAM